MENHVGKSLYSGPPPLPPVSYRRTTRSMLSGLLWLRNINTEGIDMLGFKYNINVWKKAFVERIHEYGRRWWRM